METEDELDLASVSKCADCWSRSFVDKSGVRAHLDVDSDASVCQKNY